jgi:DNA-binding transcriptional ArsR family regulator
MTRLDQTLSALADPTRRKIVDHLRQNPRRAGELATRIRISPPALSRHLRVLRKSGLIEEQRGEEDARVRVFRLRKKPFRDLNEWLADIESIWTDQLSALKAHAEKTGPRSSRRPKAPRHD